MPSPEALKGKILVKAKRLPPGKTEDEDLDESEEEEDDMLTEVDGAEGEDKEKKHKSASKVKNNAKPNYLSS